MKTILTAATATLFTALVVTAPSSVGAFSAPVAPAAINLPGEVNIESAYSSSTFPISPSDLITRTKEVLSPQIGIGTQDNGACLADSFEFVAAVVGPINKVEYLNALSSFQLEDSFNIQQNFYGFVVDPMQTNRVWFFSRQVATQVAPFMGVDPTEDGDGDDEKRELTLPPQCFHIDFTDDGLVQELGFYTVDRRQGNTGGLGGAFGYFYGVGKPLPIRECQPYKPSLRFRMLGLLGKIGKKFSSKKKE
ncbi:hypothetical protein ACHAWC_008204 [Mediolabrus comicus]